MAAFRNAIADVRRERTWTERIYYISPVLEALAQDVRAWRQAATRAHSKTNTVFAADIDQANERTLKVLSLASGDMPKVKTGPFQDMKYLLGSRGSLLGPKLLGTYESEITSWMHNLIASEVDTIVDVGCAEGYYAVGLPYSMPTVQVYAFDADPRSQELTKWLAELNGVADRVEIGGICGQDQL